MLLIICKYQSLYYININLNSLFVKWRECGKFGTFYWILILFCVLWVLTKEEYNKMSKEDGDRNFENDILIWI